MAKKLSEQPAPEKEVVQLKEQPKTPEQPKTSEALKNLPLWRVKHHSLGQKVVGAETSDQAKEKALREWFPGESSDPQWLAGMMAISMRVARLPS